MKGMAEIPIMVLIGTSTLMLSLVMPPLIIKTTIDRESMFTYEFEKVQHSLLTLFSLSEGDRNTYEIMGTNILLKKSTTVLAPQFDYLFNADENYCISIIKESSQLPTGAVVKVPPKITQDRILRSVCPLNGVQFNTLIAVPYNKNSLVEVIGIGLS